MGSWRCLFLSSRCRCRRTDRWRGPVDRIADSVRTGRLHRAGRRLRTTAGRHPGGRVSDAVACRAAPNTATPVAVPPECRGVAAAGRCDVRRRRAAPGVGGDRSAQADRSAATAADTAAAGHGLRVEPDRRARQGGGVAAGAAAHRRRRRSGTPRTSPPRCSPPIPGERVRAIAGRIEAREGRWRVVALQVGYAMVNGCRATPSASNASSRRRRARSSRYWLMPDDIPASTGPAR